MNKMIKTNNAMDFISRIPTELLNKHGWILLVAPFGLVLANDAMDKGYGLNIEFNGFKVSLAKESSIN